jgi:hypothetical protein
MVSGLDRLLLKPEFEAIFSFKENWASAISLSSLADDLLTTLLISRRGGWKEDTLKKKRG